MDAVLTPRPALALAPRRIRHLPRERPEHRDLGVARPGDQGDPRRRQHPDRPHAAGRRDRVDRRPLARADRAEPLRRTPRHARRDPRVRGRASPSSASAPTSRYSFVVVVAGPRAVRDGQRRGRRHDERRGRGDREADRQDDPAAVPRLLQLRHGDRRRARSPRRRVGHQRAPAHVGDGGRHRRHRVRHLRERAGARASRWMSTPRPTSRTGATACTRPSPRGASRAPTRSA